MRTFDDYVLATSEPGTDPYRDPCPCAKFDARQAEIEATNQRMLKLKVTGDGHRDRLVAARLQINKHRED